jgi:hypothetical protein
MHIYIILYLEENTWNGVGLGVRARTIHKNICMIIYAWMHACVRACVCVYDVM